MLHGATAEENISRTIVVDNLLNHLATVASCRHTLSLWSHSIHAIHRLDGHWIECRATRLLLTLRGNNINLSITEARGAIISVALGVWVSLRTNPVSHVVQLLRVAHKKLVCRKLGRIYVTARLSALGCSNS